MPNEEDLVSMLGAPKPAAVLAAFGIRGRVVEMVEVPGAWSNRVYRLTTTTSRYAVKQLSDPWGEAGWRGWLDVAWPFERAAFEAGVEMPEPIPNPADGGCLAWVERSPGGEPVPVRVHRWVAGSAHGPEPVDRAVAEWAGQVLAVLHGLRFRPAELGAGPALDVESVDRWPELVRRAVDARAPWASLLLEVGSAVRTIGDLARSAKPSDEPEPMSHGDLDQKNIVRSPRGPVLCDWDVAHPVVPRQELADVAMSLAGWKRIHIARAVVASYRAATGQRVEVRTSDLVPCLVDSVNWIRFNVERAIGIRVANLDAAASGGGNSVGGNSGARGGDSDGVIPGLLRQLPHQAYVAQQVDELLAAR